MNAYSCANRRIYAVLSDPPTATHRHRLDDLLKRHDNGKTTWLAPAAPVARQAEPAPHTEHIEGPQFGRRSTCLPASSGRCNQNRSSKRSPAKAGQMTPADLAKFGGNSAATRPWCALAIEGNGHRHRRKSSTCTTASW